MSDFDNQFAISCDGRPPLAGTTRHRLRSIAVDVFEKLSVTKVFDKSGEPIGMLLGTIIDTQREMLIGESLRLDAALGEAAHLDAFIEDHIYRLSGSFVFVFDAAGQRRIYLDANGTMSLVYDPAIKLAGATTALLLDSTQYRERFQTDLYDAFGVAGDGWFTAGLTAHRGVRRLLCNHYLDLDRWQAVRHWPAAQIAETAQPDEKITEITNEVTRAIRTLSRAGKVSMALTSGNETRLLLGCCRNLLSDVTFVTVNAPEADLDVERAKELAKRFGLRHELLPYRPADDVQAEAWRKRTSHGISGANVEMHPSVAPLSGQYFIGGLGGEVGRSFLWLNAEQDTRLDAAGIVSRLKLPNHPVILAEVDNWLRPISHYDTLFKLDLAYIELRMSCWAFSQSYAVPNPIELHPLVSRKNYTAMLALPPSMRRNNGLIKRGIELTWPELLSLPINRYGGWRDKYAFIRSVISRPDRALRKIRQLVSN